MTENSGRFKKGLVPWMKGRKHTAETKEKLSKKLKGHTYGFQKGHKQGMTGKHHSEETIRKIRESNIGKHHISEETQQKLSDSHKGQTAWNKGTKGLIKSWNKGKTKKDFPQLKGNTTKGRAAWNRGMSGYLANEKHYNWKGGISDYRRLRRLKWLQMRKIILERDNFKCIYCDNTEQLHVHHKIPVLDGGLDEPTNLITVCPACHSKIEKRRKRSG